MVKTGFKIAFGAWLGIEVGECVWAAINGFTLGIVKGIKKKREEESSEEE